MPSLLAHAASLAERLDDHAPAFEAAWCVRTRHRKARCTRCLDACPSGALSFAEGLCRIDKERCTGCGACTSACPTQALELPQRARIEEQLSSLDDAHPIAFVCKRLMGTLDNDDPHIAVLPCLAFLDAPLLLRAAAHGARSALILASAPCASCTLFDTEPTQLAETIDEAESLFATWTCPARSSGASSRKALPQRESDAGTSPVPWHAKRERRRCAPQARS